MENGKMSRKIVLLFYPSFVVIMLESFGSSGFRIIPLENGKRRSVLQDLRAGPWLAGKRPGFRTGPLLER
jgi:hypothetical protein